MCLPQFVFKERRLATLLPLCSSCFWTVNIITGLQQPSPIILTRTRWKEPVSLINQQNCHTCLVPTLWENKTHVLKAIQFEIFSRGVHFETQLIGYPFFFFNLSVLFLFIYISYLQNIIKFCFRFYLHLNLADHFFFLMSSFIHLSTVQPLFFDRSFSLWLGYIFYQKPVNLIRFWHLRNIFFSLVYCHYVSH